MIDFDYISIDNQCEMNPVIIAINMPETSTIIHPQSANNGSRFVPQGVGPCMGEGVSSISRFRNRLKAGCLDAVHARRLYPGVCRVN